MAHPVRVSVSEAARLFGVSTKTVRDAIKGQQVTYIVVRNRYKINFESLVKWSQINKRRQRKLANDGIGQFVNTWKISAAKYSPREPSSKNHADTDGDGQSTSATPPQEEPLGH